MKPCTRDSIVEVWKQAFLEFKGIIELPGTWRMSPRTSDWLKTWDLNPNKTWEGATIMGVPVVLDQTIPDGVLRLRREATAEQPDAFEQDLHVAEPVT